MLKRIPRKRPILVQATRADGSRYPVIVKALDVEHDPEDSARYLAYRGYSIERPHDLGSFKRSWNEIYSASLSTQMGSDRLDRVKQEWISKDNREPVVVVVSESNTDAEQWIDEAETFS